MSACVCVCVCVCARARGCVRAYAHVGVCARIHMGAKVGNECSLKHRRSDKTLSTWNSLHALLRGLELRRKGGII